MILTFGTVITSRRNGKHGTIVGNGVLQWPSSENMNGDGVPQLVYLVQIAEGSSSLGPACAVFRADQIEEVMDD